MGNDCFRTRPNQLYSEYLSVINISKLKQRWTVVELYKIRKVFESYAVKSKQSNIEMIEYESLKEIFSEFHRYQDRQIQRIYEIFDFKNTNCIDWNNFYSFITICAHAPLNILSVIMFMIFDESLAQSMNRDQLNLLVDYNANYICESSTKQAYMYDPEDIAQILIQNDEFVTIKKWQDESHKFFDFEKYRKFFNIFLEVKIQKQLIQNFESWNQIFSDTQSKYIGYIIDFKWFELWKAYCLTEYGLRINSGFKNPNNTLKTLKTLKSFKTKKTLKTINSINTQKRIINKALLKQFSQKDLIKGHQDKFNMKNYNLIHSHIGSKPQKMFNQQLQGQFHEVLAPELVQNMNYILVSEKVWKKLKQIYKGYPQFRRTGSNNIELYPKRIKIYSSLFKNKLDYSCEILRQVPCCTTVESLLGESLQISNLKQKQVFFKTIGMAKWEQLLDFSYMFTEITSQILIFLAYFEWEDAAIFRKNYCKIAQSILEVNLGDEIRYDHPQHFELKKAIYMGQTLDGKEIIHFKGSSHIYDEFIQRDLFVRKATIAHRNSAPAEEIKFSTLDIPIIPIVKNFGFINCLILMLISNVQIKSILSQMTQSYQNRQILDILGNLYRLSKRKNRIDQSLMVDFVETCLGVFVNFQFGMIDDCYQTVMQNLDQRLRKIDYRNVIKQDYYFLMVKKIKCLHCNDINVYSQKCYSLNIELPENPQKYLEFTFVPFSSTVKSLDIKKYGMKMKQTATFKQYKNQIAKLIECENAQFVVCEVYNNNIIRNFSLVKDQTTLQELNLKQLDNIFVYQLCTNMQKFVMDHYTSTKDITRQKFNIGDFIDCKTQNGEWIVGKIIQIEFMPYTQKTIFKVCHKDPNSPNQKNQKTKYELNNQTIAAFPTKSYLHSENYHLKLIQRCYNQGLNKMLPSNMPLVMVLASWMRCKEFEFMVYQQLKCFIAQNYRFKDFHELDEENCIATGNPKCLSYKFSKKQKIKRFKEYLISEHFPYSIFFLDLDGRCLICHKIHKIKISKGQIDYYCTGCKLNDRNLIIWQIKVHNCMVCIDWHGLDRFKKNIIKDHKSFTDMIMNKKNDIERLEKLIEERLTKKTLILEQLCCNFPYKTTFVEEMKIYPRQLVIQIERLIQIGSTKSINRKHINFPFDDLRVGTKMYFLTGVISIEGTNSISYKNYISNENQQWYEIHGEIIKKVKKNVVQKCCALFLIYKLKQPQENQGKLQECRQSDEFSASSQFANNSQLNSDNEKRKQIKKLTITERLQIMNEGEDDFSYLNTQKEDKIELEGFEDIQSDSEIPPERSNSKRSAKYMKDSKELIKSVSECGKSSQDDKESRIIIRLENSKENIGKSLKKQKSANNFDWSQIIKKGITFNLSKKILEDSRRSDSETQSNGIYESPQIIKVSSSPQNRTPSSNYKINHPKSQAECDSPIRIEVSSENSLSSENGPREHSRAQSIELLGVSEGADRVELINSRQKLCDKELIKDEENLQYLD